MEGGLFLKWFLSFFQTLTANFLGAVQIPRIASRATSTIISRRLAPVASTILASLVFIFVGDTVLSFFAEVTGLTKGVTSLVTDVELLLCVDGVLVLVVGVVVTEVVGAVVVFGGVVVEVVGVVVVVGGEAGFVAAAACAVIDSDTTSFGLLLPGGAPHPLLSFIVTETLFCKFETVVE